MAKVFPSISLPFAGLGVMGYIQGMQVLLGSKALLLQKGVIMESDVIDSVEASWGEEGQPLLPNPSKFVH